MSMCEVEPVYELEEEEKPRKKSRWNISGAINIGVLVGMVVFVLVAAILFPLINDQVADLTNESGDHYVGSNAKGLVSMIPVLYWLAIALTVIGVAIIAVREHF